MNKADAVPAGMILLCGVVAAYAGDVLGGAPDTGASDTGVPASLEALIGSALSLLGLVVVGWWVLALLVAIVADLILQRGPSAAARLARRCTPAVMRRLSAALLGINLIAVPSVAHAAPSPASVSSWSSAVVPSQPGDPGATASGTTPWTTTATAGDGELSPTSPGWRPAPMPVDGGALVRPPSRPAIDEGEVVVAPGDSLWSIVHRHLGPLSTPTDVAAAWPAWYETNRTIIGGDPSFLLPGQVLRAPSG